MENKLLKEIIQVILDKSTSTTKKIELLIKLDKNYLKTEIFHDFHTAKKVIGNIAENRKEIIYSLTAIADIHFENKNYKYAIGFLNNTLKEYESYLSYKEKLNILEILSLSYEDIRKFKKALNVTTKALQLSKQNENITDLIYFSKNLGNIHFKMDNYQLALQNYIIAYKKSCELKNIRNSATCLNNMGNIYFRLSNYEKALECYLDSFKIYEKINNNIQNITISLNNIGLIYYELKNYDKALEFIKKANKIEKKLNDKVGVGSSSSNLGSIYADLNDFKKAMEYQIESLKIREEIDDSIGISNSLSNIGNIFMYRKKFTKALEYYLKSLQIKEKINDKFGIASISVDIGKTYLKLKQFEKAYSFLSKSLRTAQKIDSKELLMDNYKIFSDYYSETGDFQQAFEFYKKFSDINNEISKEKNSKRITELLINFELEQKEKENEIDKLKNIADKYSLISKELEQRIERNFIGESKSIKSILKETLNAAKYKDTNVIITGESGTGKEIIARIIHHSSERKEYGFFPVNCSAIPETLMESEFFGHKKGTFTGAIEDKKGLFELAHKGTLFLDEIADMPLSLQAKLLRAIEEKKIKKIGLEQEIFVDVRIIAATNQDINVLVSNKEFRLDLYHRLNTLIINIPPLRERPEDIEPLVKHFIDIFIRKINKLNPKIDQELFNFLKVYDFPGNVRELRNLVERALIICENNILDKKCFPLISTDQSFNKISNYNIKQNEEMLIKAALKETNFNQSKAATILGISRHTLIRRISELQIKKNT